MQNKPKVLPTRLIAVLDVCSLLCWPSKELLGWGCEPWRQARQRAVLCPRSQVPFQACWIALTIHR